MMSMCADDGAKVALDANGAFVCVGWATPKEPDDALQASRIMRNSAVNTGHATLRPTAEMARYGRLNARRKVSGNERVMSE
jgi:hypothetical protein